MNKEQTLAKDYEGLTPLNYAQMHQCTDILKYWEKHKNNRYKLKRDTEDLECQKHTERLILEKENEKNDSKKQTSKTKKRTGVKKIPLKERTSSKRKKRS